MRVPSSALKIIDVHASALPAPKPATAPTNISAANLLVKRNPICFLVSQKKRGPPIRAKNPLTRSPAPRADQFPLRQRAKSRSPGVPCPSCTPLFKHSHLVRALHAMPSAKPVNRSEVVHPVRDEAPG